MPAGSGQLRRLLLKYDTAAAFPGPGDDTKYADWFASVYNTNYVSAQLVAKYFVPNMGFGQLKDLEATDDADA